MDTKIAVEILTNYNSVRTVDSGGKIICITTTETLSDVADFIEQQAKQIEEMKCCTNCKHGGGRWCELEGCINLNKWDGGSK